MVDLGRLDAALEMLDPAELRGQPAVALERARIQTRRGEAADARASLEMAGALAPYDPRLLSAWLELDARDGRLPESAVRIARAAEARPDDGRIAWLEGRVAAQQGRREEAEAHLRRAIEASPDHLRAYLDLADLLGRSGNLGRAVTVYEEAAEQHPRGELHLLLGILYESGGRRTEALARYERALAIDPSLAIAKNNLAYLLAEQGEDLDRALELARDAKTRLPNEPGVADTLGWVLFQRGAHGSATAYLREAERGYEPGDPTLGVVRLHLARAQLGSGERDAAIATLERALATRGPAESSRAGGEPSWAVPVESLLAELQDPAQARQPSDR